MASEESMMKDLLVNALVAEGDADDPGFLLTSVKREDRGRHDALYIL